MKLKTFSEKLKQYRKFSKLTQKKLSEKAGIPLSQIASYENGQRTPKVDVRRKLAKAMQLDPVELFLEEDDLDDYEAHAIMNKLIKRYATEIVRNADNTVSIKLPIDFVGLAILNNNNDLEKKDQLMDYYLDAFPISDIIYSSIQKCSSEQPDISPLVEQFFLNDLQSKMLSIQGNALPEDYIAFLNSPPAPASTPENFSVDDLA